MKYIKSIAVLAILFFTTTAFVVNEKNSKPLASKGGLEWHTDFEKARKIATEENKPIFAFFTGSDWCGWCIRLQKNVFAKKDFIDWAEENVVLLELDFPKRTQLPEDLKQQNYELASLLKVRGYPTVWFLNTTLNNDTKKVEIAPLGSTGYPSGAVAGKEEVKFIQDANRIIAKK